MSGVIGKISGDATVPFKASIYIPGVDLSLALGSQNVKLLASSLQAAGPLGTPIMPQQFGAVGDGVHDDTAAINAAIAAAPVNGMVYFPVGVYLVSSTIAVGKKMALFGSGRIASVITTNSATADVLACTAQCDIQNIGFNTTVTRTAGSYVVFDQPASGRSRLSNFWMLNGFYGVTITAAVASDYTIRDGEILQWTGNGAGVRVQNGLAVLLSHLLISQGTPPGTGTGILASGGGDVQIADCQVIATGVGLKVEPPSGGPGQASLWASDTYFDNCTQGVYLHADNCIISRAKFNGCWMSNATVQGVLMATANGGSIGGVDLIGCHICGNSNDGVDLFDAGVWDVNILGCNIAGNGGVGVDVSTSHPWRVESCRVGNSYGWGNNALGGIQVNAGADGFIIMGNQLVGNSSGPLGGAGLYTGTSFVIKDNTGWVSFNSGSGTIGIGATTAVVTHGLTGGVAPSAAMISLTPTTGMGTAGNTIWVSATTASTFTVSMTATQSAPVGFAWQARMLGAG